jgi:microsomal dipeptidase-like Zn-dependent dipeptidase
LSSRLSSEFHALGVRHVFPIHNFDNAFGGTATWNETIAVAHRYANRHVADWLEIEGCPVTPAQDGNDGYGYKMYSDQPLLNTALGALTFGIDPTSYPLRDAIEGWLFFPGTCNAKGLTGFGEGLIERLIDVGMIIDIDHMSNRSFDKTLEIAESHGYPGIVASHALMYDLHVKERRHERMRTRAQLERIAALGGMIGVMTQPPEDDDDEFQSARSTVYDPAGSVTNDCEASSKTVAASYEWAVNVMQPAFKAGRTFGVAFGTDFNGISKHNAPRFGSEPAPWMR